MLSDLFYQFIPMFFVAFGAFVLFFLFMGIGYIFKKQPLKGSCGGVANLMGEEYCQFCGNDPNKCENSQTQARQVQEKLDKLAKKA